MTELRVRLVPLTLLMLSNEMSYNSFSDLNFRITKDEIKKAISSLKFGKAMGLEKINTEMIKVSVNVLPSVYENLFNAICIYPTSWHQTWGELIVNANALIIHSFFQ